MFFHIFLFEIRNRIRRPAVYLYFAAVLIFTICTFATGSLPVGEKEHINAPYLIAFWSAGMTMMMMLVSSSIMGTPLYRDIEHNTKDYYLTYPITEAGYFWGRFAGSFVFMIAIATAIYFGVFTGSKLGPLMGFTDAAQYGPNHLDYYLHPFLTIALPNIFFTSALFFGLVAVTRNIKVIYFGGMLLFLFYFISIFFLNNTQNATVINLADPFGLSGIRYVSGTSTSTQQNTQLFSVTGAFLLNRVLWTGVGLLVLLITYFTFSFEKFFRGRRDKAAPDEEGTADHRPSPLPVEVSFSTSYQRRTLASLTRLELLNIIRDNYFWVILLSGSGFLAFVFWLGHGLYGVQELPRTFMMLTIFNDVFPFFLFFIILFYTGEVLHRDRVTRYSFIGDSLPPPNRIMNASKMITLFILAAGLSVLPVVVGVIVQLLKSYYHFHFEMYSLFVFILLLPKLFEIVIFCYLVHVVINNKFVAHAVATSVWLIVFFMESTGTFNYHPLLYSYTPSAAITDMDGIGHMLAPVSWFNLYWLIFGGLLIIVSALFFHRGVSSSVKERLQLVPGRFDFRTKAFTAALGIAFLAVGAFIYYNVSYLNNFLTKGEGDNRAIMYEKSLKHFDSMPLPKLVSAKIFMELYPEKQQQRTKAFVGLVNKTQRSICDLLLDAEGLTDYSLLQNGTPVPYSCPLIYARGMFNWFRPAGDTADFRLYHLSRCLLPSDSILLEVNSSVVHYGFANDRYGGALVRNGSFVNLGLPGLGYDEDDEISSPYVRKKNHLPSKTEKDIPLDDPIATHTLKAGRTTDLVQLDITVGTSGSQTAIAPGKLVGHWKQASRNYYRYVADEPGLYPNIGVVSARYARASDSVQIHQRTIGFGVLYHPEHSANISRFMAAYRDGIRYFSAAYGDFPFSNMHLAETSLYGPREASMSTLNAYAEYNSWNAHFTDPNQFDYCYFNATRLLSQQWWRFQVAPNNTTGSLVIPEGLATYDALVMAEKKYGKENIRNIVLDQIGFYLFIRTRLEETEQPVMRANQPFESNGKAGVVLYGLRSLIGEQNMNDALREFLQAYAFRNGGTYAGSNNLYDYLEKQVPDSLKYYLTDTWKRVCFYDNRITAAHVYPTTSPDEYKVVLNVFADKFDVDEKGNHVTREDMNDYIDVGVFGAKLKDNNGLMRTQTLLLRKYKLTRGDHRFTFIVKGKPEAVGVDPYGILIDRAPNDNIKTVKVGE